MNRLILWSHLYCYRFCGSIIQCGNLRIIFQFYQTVIFKMGNSQSTPSPVSQFEIITSFEHSHLGLIQTATDQKYKDCLVKTYHFADQMMGQEKMRRINARIKKFGNSQYILSIKKVELIPKHQMCAHNCDVTLYFEKYSHSLSSVMANRVKNKNNFTQKQIYEFVHQVLEALIFLQDNGFKNCHLDKQSIVVCGKKIKLLDLGIATSSPYQNFLDKMQQIQGFYVAPELLKDLKQKNYEPYLSPKSDVFCLGMIILQLACMEPLDCYYNFEDFSIDYESLIHRVSRIVYSYELKSLIAGMLQYESDLRFGLISAQEKVKAVLNINSSQNPNTTKRSRSSSTKMLKQLLTNSRRTITASSNTQTGENSTLQRKPSHSSLTSMASINSRYSLQKQVDDKKNHLRAPSQLYPSTQQTNNLRDLVKNRIDKPKVVETVESVPQTDPNKQNKCVCINKPIDTLSVSVMKEKQNTRLIQQARKQSFGTRTFFDNVAPQSNTLYTKQRKPSSVTPKMNEYLRRINNPPKQESIFRLIQEDSKYNSNQTNKQDTKQGITTRVYEPEFSPVPPVIPHVPETNSIKRQSPIEGSVTDNMEVADFGVEMYKQQTTTTNARLQSESPEYPSLSLRVKKTLDKMYKTTQSISSSQEKQHKFHEKSIYNKVRLPNNFYYQGQLSQNNMFEGNGVLYDYNGSIVYKGSWANNLYEGFGTLFNSQISYNKVDMFNLNDCLKNWIKYEGQFCKGEWQGFGTIYFANGERFSGCMRNGQVNGYGCFYDSGNKMTSGIWVNNKLQH